MNESHEVKKVKLDCGHMGQLPLAGDCPVCCAEVIIKDDLQAQIKTAREEVLEQADLLKDELERLIDVHLMDCEEDCVAIEVARKTLADYQSYKEQFDA